MKHKISILNKCVTTALFSCAALVGAAAHAVDSQSYTINLTATVPADTFHVIPVDTGWIDQTQNMGFDIATSKLATFTKQFQYKNTAGGIQATLTGNLNTDGSPQLSNGNDVIPLAVSFNNVKLSNTATTVVTTADAQAGGRTELQISQADDKALDVSGSFTGSVSMIFEPVVESSEG